MDKSKTQPWIITLSVAIYRKLLCHFPQEFRQEYGSDTLREFRQCCHDTYVRSGITGVVRLWPSMFMETIVDMGAERLDEALHKKDATKSKPAPIGIYITGIVMAVVALISGFIYILNSNTTFAFISIAIAPLSSTVLAYILLKRKHFNALAKVKSAKVAEKE